MRRLHMLWFRLRALVLGRRMDRELDEELQFHLAREREARVADGVAPAEAARAAVLSFGGPTQVAEACRESRGIAAFDATAADLRYAIRQIRRRPAFALAATLTVGLGVGAATLVFGIVDAVLLRPLPFGEADRLYSLYEINSRANIGRTRASALNFLDWRQQARSFDGMAGYVGTGFTFTGRGDADFALGQLVTPNLFDLLRVQPALGRVLRADDAEPANCRVVVLSHQLWTRWFGADPGIVGQYATVNGKSYLVAGVMPPGFQYPSREYQLWAPLVTRRSVPDGPPISRDSRYLRVVARLTPGVDERVAREELAAVSKRLSEAYPDDNANVSIGAATLAADVVGESANGLLVLLAAVGFVLLIACVNVAGLTLARGSTRGREMAIRAAIGASRRRLVRQLVTESLVVYAIGGAIGIAMAAWAIGWLPAVLPAGLPRTDEITIDWRVVAFGVVVTLASGILFSLLPALGTARRGLASNMAGTGRVVSPGRGALRVRGGLIVAQVAAAIVLLAGAALAVRSFDRVRHADKGFDPAQTMTFQFAMPEARYADASALRSFAARSSESIGALPGVEAAGITTHLPLGDNNLENSFTVDGSPVPPGADGPIAGLRGVSAAYRAAIGARLLQGRDLGSADGEGAQPVAVVTDSFARRHIVQANPIGVRLKMGDADSDDPWRTIVGVIADIRHARLDDTPRPEVWLPYAQLPDGLMTRWLRGVGMVVRTSTEPTLIVPLLRSAMRDLDRDMPLVRIQTLEHLALESTGQRRLETWVLGGFAATAVLLAAIGLFGVLAFYVTQHLQEFGLRLALGATPGQLMRLVIRRALVLLAAGLAVGLPAALLMGRAMRAILYETAPADPVALGAAVALLAAVTLAACALPARRAMRTDPLTALRQG